MDQEDRDTLEFEGIRFAARGVVYAATHHHRSIEIWRCGSRIYAKGFDTWNACPERPHEKISNQSLKDIFQWAAHWLKGGAWIE